MDDEVFCPTVGLPKCPFRGEISNAWCECNKNPEKTEKVPLRYCQSCLTLEHALKEMNELKVEGVV